MARTAVNAAQLKKDKCEAVASFIRRLIAVEDVILSFRGRGVFEKCKSDSNCFCLTCDRIVPVARSLTGIEIERKLDGKLMRSASSRI
jgi:hypothetical protein